MRIRLLLVACFVFIVSGPVYAGTQTTSTATVQNIIDQVRLEIWQPSVRSVSDTDLLNWINDGIVELVSRTGCLEESTVTITVVANQYVYPITTNFLTVEGVWYDSGDTTDTARVSTLVRAPIHNIRSGQEKERGRPKAFTVWDNDLVVWPIPSSDHAAQSLEVWLVSMPTKLTATTDAIGLPYYLDPALVYYVSFRSFLKHSDTNNAASYKAMFDELVKNAVENIVRRTVLR